MMAAIIPKGKKMVITDYDLVQFQPFVMNAMRRQNQKSFNDDEGEIKRVLTRMKNK